MPPKQKFSREEIIEAALQLIRSDGLIALTARNLGTVLGSSSRPIFTAFKNMEEVQMEAVRTARQLYNQKIKVALEEEYPFRSVGQEYIRFAKDEPRLFQILFMSEKRDHPNSNHILEVLDDNNSSIQSAIEKEYQLEAQQAQTFYHELWIFTHGIASLIATGVCSFTPEQIESMSADVCLGVLHQMKGK